MNMCGARRLLPQQQQMDSDEAPEVWLEPKTDFSPLFPVSPDREGIFFTWNQMDSDGISRVLGVSQTEHPSLQGEDV